MDDRHLLKLAKLLAPGDYITLGITLGIPQPELEIILAEKGHRYTESFLDVFHRWKASQHSDRLDLWLALVAKLRQAELGELADQMINTVSAELRDNILDVKNKVLSANSVWQEYDAKLHQSREQSTKHFTDIEEEIASIYGKELNTIDGCKREKEAIINEEADDQIRRINAEREERLKQCQADTAKQRQPIESRRLKLINDVTSITNTTKKKIKDLQHGASDVMQDLEDASERMETLLGDDTELLNGAQQLITSLTDTLGKKADADVVEHITRTVNGVRFIEGKGNDKYNGRIGGFEGKWELSSTVEIPCDITQPFIAGCTSKDDIIIADLDGGENHTYCFNIKNKLSQRVSLSDGKARITSCALLDDDTIVCGKVIIGYTGSSLHGCISLYNREWELIRDITIPRNTTGIDTGVYIAVTQDRMIIAHECYQNCSFVINPNDGCIVNTFRCEEEIGLMRGVLTAGDVIIQPYPCSNTLLMIDRQGAQREITHSETILHCAIDPLTDDLYVVHWDEGRMMAAIGQMSGEGHQERSTVTSFPLHDNDDDESFLAFSSPVITASGDMVVCNGRECLIFEKGFTL